MFNWGEVLSAHLLPGTRQHTVLQCQSETDTYRQALSWIIHLPHCPLLMRVTTSCWCSFKS